MDNFEPFLYEMIYQDESGIKQRPVILLSKNDECCELICIHSFRNRFSENPEFVEITHLHEAGLERRSFAKISHIVQDDAEVLKNIKPIGKLSDYDVFNLVNALTKYYGTDYE